MNPLKIRHLEIGTGKPKIAVPLVETTRQSILEEARSLEDLPFDLVEWRADWFEGVEDVSEVLEVLKGLRTILKETPILMTFRTAAEGGKRSIDPSDYVRLNLTAARSGLVDLIDVEIPQTPDDLARTLIEEVHQAGAAVIGSSHDFSKTLSQEQIVSRLEAMEALGADILKIAQTPQSQRDVLTLLQAGQTMSETSRRPLILISMGSLGLVSRLCGEAFGSAVTFGAAGRASAPGQMNVRDLNTVLNLVHQSM